MQTIYPQNKAMGMMRRDAQKLMRPQRHVLEADAADMAAQSEDLKAPVIPTSNIRPKPMNMGFGPNNGTPNANPRTGSSGAPAPRAPQPVSPPVAGPGALVGRGSVPSEGLGATGTGLNTGPASDTRSVDQMYEDALRKLIGEGPRNTAADEKLIRDQMLRDVGAGQADLNARMAAGGFGTSGALGAMSTDMRSKAALDAAKAITDVQQNSRDEWLDRVTAGMRGEQGQRDWEIRDAQMQMWQNIMNQMINGSSEPTGGTPSASLASSGGGTSGYGDMPKDAFSIGTDENGNTIYYSNSTNKRYTKSGK